MKTLSTPLLAILATLCVIAMLNVNQAANEKAPLLRHVVQFKFKDDATKEQVQEVVDAFRKLPSQMDVIHAFEFGVNNSPEGLNKGFTHCFLVTFKGEKEREAYLPHPAHQAFVAKLKPILDDVQVIDYWAHE
jgi:hypothetical protein